MFEEEKDQPEMKPSERLENMLLANPFLRGLRPCEFKIYIEHKEVERKGPRETKWIPGFFHLWGLDYEEFQDGAVSFTIGIVEDMGGRMTRALIEDIRFWSP